MLTLEEVRLLIDEDTTRQAKIAKQLAYVKGENPAILNPAPKEEPDSRVPVPFAKKAVEIMVGYLLALGNIKYKGDGFDDDLKEIFRANEESLLDAELGRTACAHGESFELHYFADGAFEFAQIPVGQCIPIWSTDLKPKMVGFVRYWTMGKDIVAYVYDTVNVCEMAWEDGKQDGSIIEDPSPHGYSGSVPVVRFTISDDGSNLFDHVIYLIDLFDKIISEDWADELARFAGSYMHMDGTIDDSTEDDRGETELDKIKRVKIFFNTVKDQIGFITKQINEGFVKSASELNERLIYDMLMLFNPNDDTFNTASGEASKYKLLPMEYLASKIAAYFTRGLKERIRLVNVARGVISGEARAVDSQVEIEWTRTLPENRMEWAAMAVELNKVFTKRTVVNAMPDSLIPDKESEIQELEDDNAMTAALFAPPKIIAPPKAKDDPEVFGGGAANNKDEILTE